MQPLGREARLRLRDRAAWRAHRQGLEDRRPWPERTGSGLQQAGRADTAMAGTETARSSDQAETAEVFLVLLSSAEMRSSGSTIGA